MKKIIIAIVLVSAMVLTSIISVSAAMLPGRGAGSVSPSAMSGNASQMSLVFDRFVFVQYADNLSGSSTGGLQLSPATMMARHDIAYYINPTGGRITENDSTKGIAASFQTWQNASGNRVVFTYQGITNIPAALNATGPDFKNVISWASLNDTYPGAIAVTVLWSSRGTKTIVDSDTILNSDAFLAWTQVNITADPDTVLLPQTNGFDVDLQNIMTHETGHWVQLVDLYTKSSSELTMSGFTGDRELKKRTLESADITGLLKIYH